MAFTPYWGTGFEMGHVELNRYSQRSNSAITSNPVQVHTGTYALNQGSGYWLHDFEPGGNQIDIALWWRTTALSNNRRIRIILADGLEITLRSNGDYYDVYRDSTLIASGTRAVTDRTAFHHIQLSVSVANAGGTVETIIDGDPDISFTGDTQPGTSDEITEFGIQSYQTGTATLLDDIVVGTGGAPGDWRWDVLIPDGDTATEDWDLSAGADSYALIDDVPPDEDTSYLYSGTDAQQTIVTLTDWDSTNKTPQAAMAWVRAKKNEAAAHHIKIINSDGINTNIGAAHILDTSYQYDFDMLTTAPDGGAWSDADLDDLQIGAESEIA